MGYADAWWPTVLVPALQPRPAATVSFSNLLSQGLNPCPEGLGPSLMHHLILQLADHPFAKLIDQPGTAEAL